MVLLRFNFPLFFYKWALNFLKSWERIKLFEQNLFLEEGIEAWDSYSEKRLNSFLFLIFLQCGYCEPHFLINIFFKKSIISFPFHQWLVFYLKSPIFIVQRAYIPKNGVEFRQQTNSDNRTGVATSCDVARRRATSQTSPH